jgi:glucosamine--fructose-6-phosphate aminotransferase (isomerizing)
MCGIVAYKGKHNCLPFLLDGLTKLEYRGYDSAGISVLSYNGLQTYKSVGSVEELRKTVPPNLSGLAGVSHTRWATHGKVCLENCHPFASWDNRLVLVHNGIVENYLKLKTLLKYPERLKGDTDSEVLLCLLSEKYGENNDLLGAIKNVCSMVEGAFALVILGENGQFIIVRKASSLVVGIGKDEVMVSSDGLSLGKNCEKIIYVPDNSICDLTNGFDNFLSLENLDSVSYEIEDYKDNPGDADKMGFDHFMLKEIYDQPVSVVDCLRGRIDKNNSIKLGGLMGYENLFNENSHITIVSCGSSYYSGLLGKYFIEELCGIKVSVEHSGEFRYRNNNSIKKNDIVIAISQSGETADTIGALQEAKNKGAKTIGIVNVVNSSIGRLTDCGIHTRAGREIGVASTKAFTNQIVSMLLLALWIEQNSKVKIIDRFYRNNIIDCLQNIHHKITQFLNNDHGLIKRLAKDLCNKKGCLFLGRGVNYPVALEGSLKLKELSYIYSEGFSASEMKHGPIALIDSTSLAVALLNNKAQSLKMINNIREIQSRGASVAGVSDDIVDDLVYNILIEDVIDILSPLLSIVPLQLLAYYTAVYKGYNVDKPRNLAKSVTVE